LNWLRYASLLVVRSVLRRCQERTGRSFLASASTLTDRKGWRGSNARGTVNRWERAAFPSAWHPSQPQFASHSGRAHRVVAQTGEHSREGKRHGEPTYLR